LLHAALQPAQRSRQLVTLVKQARLLGLNFRRELVVGPTWHWLSVISAASGEPGAHHDGATQPGSMIWSGC
jgi:hypothetical protein